MYRSNYFILTGGPGSGKTTTLKELEVRGCVVVPEVARAIIREQVLVKGNALPGGDVVRYSGLMLMRSVYDYMKYGHTDVPCFFDRGIPDVLAYNDLTDIPGPAWRDVALDYRYNRSVFVFPPWKEIYRTDNERKQTFDVAVETYRMIRKVYLANGYDAVEVPFMSPEERAAWIEGHVNRGMV